MEDSQQPFDPYAPPQTQGYQPSARKMSGGVKAICIIALILGIMGLAQAVLGGVGLMVGPRAQQWFNPPQPDQNLREMQQEMQGEMNAIAARFLPLSIARILFHLVVATLLVIGAISTLGVVAMSILTAAFLKSMFELLTIGCFPFFILMFFSECMFPLPKVRLFHIAGHMLYANDILPTSLTVKALNKTLNYGAGIGDVLFELTAIVVLAIAYFALGTWLFRRRHMRV